MRNSISTPVNTKTYSYHSRFASIEDAKEKARQLNGVKHAYYTKIQTKGVSFFDVRTEN